MPETYTDYLQIAAQNGRDEALPFSPTILDSRPADEEYNAFFRYRIAPIWQYAWKTPPLGAKTTPRKKLLDYSAVRTLPAKAVRSFSALSQVVASMGSTSSSSRTLARLTPRRRSASSTPPYAGVTA